MSHNKKPAFNPNNYVKNGITLELVNEIKSSFDLFDTDQGGSINLN